MRRLRVRMPRDERYAAAATPLRLCLIFFDCLRFFATLSLLFALFSLA